MKSSVGKMRTAPGHSSKIGGTFTTPDGKQLKSAKRSEPQKNFRLQPKPVEKEVSGTKDFPSKSRNFKKKSCR